MSTRAFVTFILAVGSGVLGCGTRTESRTVERTAVDHGRAIFSDPTASSSPLNSFSCATCHTAEAPAERIYVGGSLVGAAARATYWSGQENDLLRSINHCRFYFMLAKEPWTPADEEAKAMYAYLGALGGPPTPVPFTVVALTKDLVPGDAQVGAQAYASACQTCHGTAHTGEGRLTTRAPVLPEDTVAAHKEYTPVDRRLVFIEKARHGGFLGYGGSMPPFSKEGLSDKQMAGLLVYFNLY